MNNNLTVLFMRITMNIIKTYNSSTLETERLKRQKFRQTGNNTDDVPPRCFVCTCNFNAALYGNSF